MKNNKGFTLIEILAAVTILGIISTIAVVAVSKYIDKSRNEAYDTMEKTLCDAAKNYVMNEGLDSSVENGGATIDVSTLAEYKYVGALLDPADKSKSCDGQIVVKLLNKAASADSLNDYTYDVTINCTRRNETVKFNSSCQVRP